VLQDEVAIAQARVMINSWRKDKERRRKKMLVGWACSSLLASRLSPSKDLGGQSGCCTASHYLRAIIWTPSKNFEASILKGVL
jgi:hypothetical protein